MKIYSSFRDPAGYVFTEDNAIYRTISKDALADFDMFVESKLYDKLAEKGLIVKFINTDRVVSDYAKVVEVEKIPFITYPYEWSFSMIKDAALLTLEIQLLSLEYGMILKDASAYNVQFRNSKAIFIDLLSFTKFKDGESWIAYKQFVQFFYGVLLLMSRKDISFNNTLLHNIDGIPVELISKLLPKSTYFNISVLMHIHLHARMVKRHQDSSHLKHAKAKHITKKALVNIIEQLKDAVESIKLPRQITEWGNYYRDTNYNEDSFNSKKNIIENIAKRFQAKRSIDLGANDGTYSRVIAKYSENVISADIDPIAVEHNYNTMVKNVTPVLQNLVTPSPAIGFMNKERESFLSRVKGDVVYGLALIHHLAISNNLPFNYIAEMFYSVADIAVIEFVPKDDSQVQRLLATRVDIFDKYTEDEFVSEFVKLFKSYEVFDINDSLRKIYIFKKL